MTATTSLKLTDELKAQIADTAKRRGKTAHALMVETLQQAMDDAQLDDEFYQDALRAREDMIQSNVSYSHEEISTWMRAKLRGENPRDPMPQAYDASLPMRPELAPRRAAAQARAT